jgi:uncharacterized protein (TIGR02118 family)
VREALLELTERRGADMVLDAVGGALFEPATTPTARSSRRRDVERGVRLTCWSRQRREDWGEPSSGDHQTGCDDEGGILMIKLVFMVRRREGITREEFQRYWKEEHAELVKRHAELLRIRRYVQTHARDTDLDHAIAESRGSVPSQYDGAAELWWDSIDDLVQAATSEGGQTAQQALLEDERRFIDLANSAIWLGEEIAVVGAP